MPIPSLICGFVAVDMQRSFRLAGSTSTTTQTTSVCSARSLKKVIATLQLAQPLILHGFVYCWDKQLINIDIDRMGSLILDCLEALPIRGYREVDHSSIWEGFRCTYADAKLNASRILIQT